MLCQTSGRKLSSLVNICCRLLTLNCWPEKGSCWHTKNRISMIETIIIYVMNADHICKCPFQDVMVIRIFSWVVNCLFSPWNVEWLCSFFPRQNRDFVSSQPSSLHGKPTRRAFSLPAGSQLWWFFKMIICELICNNRLPWTFSFIMFCNRLLTLWLRNKHCMTQWNPFDPSECVLGGTRFFVFCCLWKSGAVKLYIYRTRLFFKTFGMKCPSFFDLWNANFIFRE